MHVVANQKMSGQLVLEVKGRSHAPGDAVRGRVRLSLERTCEALLLVVCLRATRRVVLPGRGVAVAFERATLFETIQQLEGERLYQDGASFPFELLVPDNALQLGLEPPSPFPLEWSVFAALRAPFRATLKATVPLRVAVRAPRARRRQKSDGVG